MGFINIDMVEQVTDLVLLVAQLAFLFSQISPQACQLITLVDSALFNIWVQFTLISFLQFGQHGLVLQ
jgi:hypothetical protein